MHSKTLNVNSQGLTVFNGSREKETYIFALNLKQKVKVHLALSSIRHTLLCCVRLPMESFSQI